MLNKLRLWVRSIENVSVGSNSRGNSSNCSAYRCLPRNIAFSFFSRIPIVSFYPKTLLAIGILRSLPDIDHTLSGSLYLSTLKVGSAYFGSISEIIRTVYKIQKGFNEIKYKRSQQFFTGFDEITDAPLYRGGKCFIELLDNNTLQATIYLDDDEFSDIKRELNRIARKRLAIGILVFGIAAVLIGVLR